MYQDMSVCRAAGVCEQKSPSEKKTGGDTSFQSTESGAGEQLLLPNRNARACTKGVLCFVTDTDSCWASLRTCDAT